MGALPKSYPYEQRAAFMDEVENLLYIHLVTAKAPPSGEVAKTAGKLEAKARDLLALCQADEAPSALVDIEARERLYLTDLLERAAQSARRQMDADGAMRDKEPPPKGRPRRQGSHLVTDIARAWRQLFGSDPGLSGYDGGALFSRFIAQLGDIAPEPIAVSAHPDTLRPLLHEARRIDEADTER